MTASFTDEDPTNMFRPPINRAMSVLDRSFFRKTVPLAAARVLDERQILKSMMDLNRDVLRLDRMTTVKSTLGPQGDKTKVLLLRPEIKSDDPSSWSPKLSELVKCSQVAVVPYSLDLDYGFWKYYDIVSSILPENYQDELPIGFSVVGHIAHLNLREQYLPYKNLIATVLLDKTPHIRTVINKIDEVGEHSEYRTFKYELLAGDPNMNVEVNQLECRYRFDYSQVYWNSRLDTEHERLVCKFQPEEVVCDVMAGVGPFAIPAGRKRCFVWANDLNPHSYTSLVDAVKRNKVSDFVKPFCDDGRAFISTSAEKLLTTTTQVDVTPTQSRRRSSNLASKDVRPTILTSPKTFNHYVLNLPASAITFLPAFIGLYRNYSDIFEPHTQIKLPMIHVYCFSKKADDNTEAEEMICKEISEQLGFEVKPGDGETEGKVSIWDVRDVSPQKRMFCASFRLPKEVAYRDPLVAE